MLSSAVAGIDQALWDIAGKALGVPVWQLLGGNVRDRIRVYSWIGGDRPTDVAEAAAARRAEGFTAIKMNASAQLRLIDTPNAVHDIVARVASVRERVGTTSTSPWTSTAGSRSRWPGGSCRSWRSTCRSSSRSRWCPS